jgi:hypothetical protein
MKWQFTFPDIVPYVRTTQRQKFVDPRYQRYAEWKKSIRLVANTAGVPAELDKENIYGVQVIVKWKNKARADLDNAGIKNVLDALWPQDRSIVAIVATTKLEHGSDELDISISKL